MSAKRAKTTWPVTLFLAAWAWGVGQPTRLGATDSNGIAFFENKIRPVLVKECYSCHSAESKKSRGGLVVDTRDGLLKGGDTGPAIQPGKPTESLLLKALRHDEIEMPPKGRLANEIIADFERWIAMGAPDPRKGGATVVKTIDLAEGRKFWSFQPRKQVAPPKVNDTAWARSDVDRFVLAALEAKGLKPAGDANRATLLRRIHVALVGMLPTPAEIDAFVQDDAPDALAKVVDRLLDSPHFGERWGRHWLDLARYADSSGKDENLTFQEAWRYRDYVIEAFNRDKPFDQFVTEQLAGDLMPAESIEQRDERLIATSFLLLGPKLLAERDKLKLKMDVVDEQLDTIGRAFLGLSLGCARCHDHKFDPIPTTDYYALAGILASTLSLDGNKLGSPYVSGWPLRPLGKDGDRLLADYLEHQKKLRTVAADIKKLKADLASLEDKASMRVPAQLVGVTVDDKDAHFVGYWKPSTYGRPYVGDSYVHDDKSDKGKKSATFTPDLPKAGAYEVFLAYTTGANRSKNTPVTIRHADGEKKILVNQREEPKLDGLFRSLGVFRFEAGKKGSVVISNEETTDYVIVDAVRFVPAGALGRDPEMAMGVPTEIKDQLGDLRKKLTDLECEEKKLKSTAPKRPPMAMAVRDEEKVADLRVHVRGNPHSLGEAVPRGYLRVVSLPGPPIPSQQSGRLELAQWLTHPDHPLTARVAVNRIWKHLFGEGLVRTVDDFGAQGERPSHPELLDYLANRFVAEGWSTKKLIRALVLSRTYGLAVGRPSTLTRADPDNRWFGRASRRRVDAEVLRDSILQVAGRLDRTRGGSTVVGMQERAVGTEMKGDLAGETSRRRSVYVPVIRNELPALFEAFDFADPDVATGRRNATTVPTQALYLMNSPFVQDNALYAARQLMELKGDESARLSELYRRVLGRAPSEKESDKALKYLENMKRTLPPTKDDADPVEVRAWSAICQALFACTEFRFVE
jgi:hypothetical protein